MPHTLNILLIEDNPGDAKFIEEMIREGLNEPASLLWRLCDFSDILTAVSVNIEQLSATTSPLH